jgi:sugar phosphate isomerase/epimerase
VDDVLKIIRHMGLPNVKLLADTFHMNIEETDLAASLKRVGPDLGFVHLVDSNRQAPGHGHLDIRGVLGALRGIGYQGYLSFEILPLPTSRQAAEDAIRFVKGILSDL